MGWIEPDSYARAGRARLSGQRLGLRYRRRLKHLREHGPHPDHVRVDDPQRGLDSAALKGESDLTANRRRPNIVKEAAERASNPDRLLRDELLDAGALTPRRGFVDFRLL
jgi:hypothetical protein